MTSLHTPNNNFLKNTADFYYRGLFFFGARDTKSHRTYSQGLLHEGSQIRKKLLIEGKDWRAIPGSSAASAQRGKPLKVLTHAESITRKLQRL
jgi:hypothetical protein